MFKQGTRVCHKTLKSFWRGWSYLQRKNIHMRETISIKSRVAMSLQMFGTGTSFYTIGEVYGVANGY
jgi:hypothetical protein